MHFLTWISRLTPPSNHSPAVFQFAVVRQYLPYLVKIGTPSLRRHLLELIPSDALQRVKEIVDTMHNTSVNIFKRKKAALEAGEEVSSLEVGKGKDLMSLLRQYLLSHQV